MATLADAIRDVQDIVQIWHAGAWATLRQTYATRRKWYKGDEWKRKEEERQADGDYALVWPLQINPIAKACRIHRAIMLGVQDDILDEPPVRTIVLRGHLTESQRTVAEDLERLLARVWYESLGIATQFESCLKMQYYGGHVFQVRWEPTNPRLSTRIAVRSYESPSVFWPVQYDPVTYELLDAYIGYEIDKDYAKTRYGIRSTLAGNNVLYLEHWTRSEHHITVDGQTPVERDAEGNTHRYREENAWGIVPIVYAPHERDDGFWGRSLVDDDSPLVGMAKEWNARMADKGDALQDSKPIIYATNTRRTQLTTEPLTTPEGKVLTYVVNLGDSNPVVPGARPEMGVAQWAGMSTAVAQFSDEVKSDFRSQADLAAVAFGEDDVSGGRITGPVTAYRMLPTTMHTVAERAAYTTAMVQIANLIRTVALERLKSGAYAVHGLTPPRIDAAASELLFGCAWNPMLPIEQEQRVDILNARLQAEGISLLQYLREIGVQDPEAEAAEIWKDRERQANIEAMARVNAMNQMMNMATGARDGNKSNGGNNGS